MRLLYIGCALTTALWTCSCSKPPAKAPETSRPRASGAAPIVAPPEDPYEGTAPPEEREPPPPSGLAPSWSFPAIVNDELDNGLGMRLVERHNLPVVDIELVVLSGSASDGAKPGLAVVAGELLKAGGAGRWSSRALLDEAESLGSSIDILTDSDSTRVSMAVTSDHFEDALGIIATVAQKPRFDYGEFVKLKRREMDRVESLARTNAEWAASMVLYEKLFRLPAGVHPYSHYDATAGEIDKLGLYDCRTWHREHFAPDNAFVTIAGDISADDAKAAVSKAFGAWRGKAAEPPRFTAPTLPDRLELYLVDRPESPQAEIMLATLGPERTSDEWAALRATNQILGGGVAGRLFLDVREKRSLAYSTGSHVQGLAHGPVPIVLDAGTQTAKAGVTVGALIEHMDAMREEAPTEDEVDIATRYLSDVFLLSVDTVGAIGRLTSRLGILGLPDDYYDTYRAKVREIGIADVEAITAKYFKPGRAIVVVAGDADRLAGPLSHFGPVTVIDADEGFKPTKTLDHDPTAPIELERIDGT